MVKQRKRWGDSDAGTTARCYRMPTDGLWQWIPQPSRSVAQHGFYARPSAHLRSLATGAGFGTISRSSGVVRFVQGGVVKTFRCANLDERGWTLRHRTLTNPSETTSVNEKP